MAGCRERGVRYSVGLSVDQKIQDAIELVPEGAWTPAISADGEPRGNGEIVAPTALLDLRAWPVGSRVICRRERPHPGAQYRFTDLDGHRFQVMVTDTPAGGNDIAALELRQRQHARMKTGSAAAKTADCGTCQDLHANATWVELASPRRITRPGPKPSASPVRSANSNPNGCATAPYRSPVGSSAPDGA